MPLAPSVLARRPRGSGTGTVAQPEGALTNAAKSDAPDSDAAESDAAARTAAASRAIRSDRAHRRLVGAAALLLASGLVVAVATGWDWWSRVRQIRANQSALTQAVDAAWAAPAPRAGAALPVQVPAPGTGAPRPGAGEPVPAAEGAPIARLHLPRMGLTLVVVEGVRDGDLLRGPGHITGTPRFGESGNAGIAGHRYPGVFWDLDALRTGDPVVVETADRWYVYRVIRSLVVEPDDTRVLAARPDGAPPGADRFLTLVTCDPRFTTAHRLIRQAALARVQPRGAVPPPEVNRSEQDR